MEMGGKGGEAGYFKHNSNHVPFYLISFGTKNWIGCDSYLTIEVRIKIDMA